MKAALTAALSRITLTWVLLALVVILLILLVLLMRRRLRNAPATLPRRRLLEIWHAFLHALPRRARGAVARYPWVMVLGESGVGKSQLIDSQVDWQGLQSQFLPSYSSDPLLQVYIGHGVVVHELGAPLLSDGSPAALAALSRLWRGLMNRWVPRAVVVLDAHGQTPPEQLRRTVQRMRGKLGALGELCRAPIATRVCLTHMDQLPGYPVYAQLMRGRDLASGVPLGDRRDVLTALDFGPGGELPTALISLSSQQFRELLFFLKQIDERLVSVSEFVQLLTEDTPLFRAPVVDSLCLFSPQADEQVGDAIKGQHRRSRDVSRLRSPAVQRLLQVLSLLTAGAALSWILVQYFGERQRVRQAEEAVATLAREVDQTRSTLDATMESTVVQSAGVQAGRRVAALYAPRSRWSLAARLYTGRKQDVKQLLVQSLRQAYLLPALERSRAKQDADRTLRALAILYATRTNKLGQAVRQQGADIARLLGVPEQAIDDYIQNSDTPWGLRVSLPPFPAAGQPTPATDLGLWQQLFLGVEKLYRLPLLTKQHIVKLNRGVQPYLRAIDEVRRSKQTRELFPLLAEEASLDPSALFGRSLGQGPASTWVTQNDEPLRSFLEMLQSTTLDGPAPTWLRAPPPLSLTPVARVGAAAPIAAGAAPIAPGAAPGPADPALRVRTMLAQLSAQTSGDAAFDRTFRFALNTKSFVFGSRQWWELVLRSRKKVVVTNIVHGRHGKRRAPLLDWSGGTTTDGELPQLYTKDTFERLVRPTIHETERALANPQLDAREKKLLSRFVLREMETYAQGYRAALLQQLQRVALKRDSIGALHVALAEMLQPTSAFTEALVLVADNASLERLEGPFLRPMVTNQVLFAPLLRLMVKKDGAYPELEKYRTQLSQVVRDLDDRSRPGGPGEPALPELLSPAGRVALQILLEQEASPLRQVEGFLDKAGVIGPLRQPFVDPLLQVYRFGLQDISKVIAVQWTQQMQRQVTPLLSRFPFNRRAAQDVDLTALEALRPTEGVFWQRFQHVFAPVCAERAGGWAERRGALAQVELPRDMLPMVNQLLRLSRILWDKDGKRKPLVYQISPKVLPTPAPAEAKIASATLSFLNHGQSSVFGLNTRTASSALSVAWWTSDSASVGIEISLPAATRKQTLSVDIAGAPFSFFHLVAQARLTTDGLATWSVPAERPGWSREVRFHLGGDPFAPFQIRVP